MSHGRTYDEQRFSPLTRITKDNVKTLGLSWFVDLDTHRGAAWQRRFDSNADWSWRTPCTDAVLLTLEDESRL